MLNVVYDLRVLPPTFDFLYFIAIAYARMMLETNQTQLRLWIITGESRRPRDWDWSDSMSDGEITYNIRSRLNRVILPATTLFPFIAAVNVIDDRCIASLTFSVFHPKDYNHQRPALGIYHKGWNCLQYSDKIDMRCLKNSQDSLVEATLFLKQTVGSERPVVITLRNNRVSHDASRNSRYEVLDIIINFLLENKIPVGIIPDTSLQGDAVTRYSKQCLVAPAFDVVLRSAIYESAAFSLFEPTGPLGLAQLNRNCKFIAYGIAWSEKFSADYQIARGYKPNVNFLAPEEITQIYFWDSLSLQSLKEWLVKIGSPIV